MDQNGTITDEVRTPDFPPFEDWPSWSPTGAFLAYVAGSSEFNTFNTVYVQDFSGFDAVALPGCFPTSDHPQWSPDGSRLLCLSNPGIIGGALTSVRRDGQGVRLLSPSGVEVVSASFLPDGSVVYNTGQFSSLGPALFHVGALGGTPVHLFDLPSDIFAEENLLALSPDGTRITYLGSGPEGGGLQVSTLDGSAVHRISADLVVGYWSAPAWSPDGTQVAFLGSPPAGPYGVWLAAPDGSTLRRLPIPGSPDFNSEVTWSPDGARLLVSVTDPDANFSFSRMFVIRPDGSGLQELTGGKAFDVHAAWQP
jgi:Tol biopolymer transport system component